MEDGSCDPGTITGDPNLGPLAPNGGPTETHALLAGSPAIDAADDTICAAPPVNNRDQRGETRPKGPACDIGSVEVNALLCNGLVPTIVGTQGNNTLTGTNGNDVIHGLGGNDIINGGNGIDQLFGENGNDALNGGAGSDTCNGGNGKDTGASCETQTSIP